MRLKSFTIKNFRGYKEEAQIEMNNLTVFVGRNDIGKSTILEALDIFFNDKNAINPLVLEDINKEAAKNGDLEVKLTATFEDVPESIIIDESVSTTLQDEMLLDSQGCLTVVKRYLAAGKPKITIKANHPTNPECNNLLLLKISSLKEKAADLVCEDRGKKTCLRKAIWNHFSDDLQLSESEIETTGDGLKDIWAKLEKHMPIYSLFQSDRSNSDKDKEAQDPLKQAVKEIFAEQEILKELENVANKVREKLQSVTDETLNKIKEMNYEIAETLSPFIPPVESLKWADVFKNVSITSDNEISINKRGSGVKRLILLNFFRAKAQRMMHETKHSDIIYAIEEPETSQHIDHQRLLIKSIKKIAENPHAQIILTTHSSYIVKMMLLDNLRLVSDKNGFKSVERVNSSCLPWSSLNEINYLAFNDYSIEYHNELFGYLNNVANDENNKNKSLAEFDNWLVTKGSIKDKVWKKMENNGKVTSKKYTIHMYIRNKIHHPENRHNKEYSNEELIQSIEEMRRIAFSLKK